MRQLTPNSGLGLPHEYPDTAESDHSEPVALGSSEPVALSSSEPVALPSMVETAARTHNADFRWKDFSSQDYWHRNYKKVLPPDREIIRLVGSFFSETLHGHARVQRAIDVGSGTNLYPALLMLPWTEQILLTDYSESNVQWLRRQVMDDDAAWTWQPFWQELQALKGYDQVSEPHKQLRVACTGQDRECAIEEYSVFDLPAAQWQLGTMFFVAESITRDPREFDKAIGRFVGALERHSPFAAAFMKGSEGYPVGDVTYPALPVTADDISEHFTRRHRVSELNVKEFEPSQLVRDGYEGMIVATGITGDH
jgi:hypothetical protein